MSLGQQYDTCEHALLTGLCTSIHSDVVLSTSLPPMNSFVLGCMCVVGGEGERGRVDTTKFGTRRTEDMIPCTA